MRIVLSLVIILMAATSAMAASFTYSTTADQDAIIAWELARRATASKTPPKDGQALLTIEIGHLLRTWQAGRKAEAIAKLQDDPTSLTVEDKVLLGIK